MEPDDKLAAALDRELKALPDLPAPASFAAGVMAMVRAYELRPWWLRAWVEWPLPVQGARGVGGGVAGGDQWVVGEDVQAG